MEYETRHLLHRLEGHYGNPLGSCFQFDFDPRDMGLEISTSKDAPLAKHMEFTDEDKKWLNDMMQ